MHQERAGQMLLFALSVCFTASLTQSATGSDVPSHGRIVFTQFPPVASRVVAQDDSRGTRDAERLPRGARIAVFDASAPERGATNLTPDFAYAGRPNLSFDGSRILFVGKRRAADPFGIWEMAADGSDPREVLRFSSDCVRVVHLSTIFGVDTDLPIPQMAFVARAPDDEMLSIFTCRMDGSSVRRITFAPGGASDPFPLSDGRLLFRMGLNDDKAAAPNPGPRPAALFTVNTDGTDIFPFAGFELESAGDVREPCETPSGLIFYGETRPGTGACDRLAAVARTGSLHSRSVIADQEGASFRTPSASADGKLLISYRPTNAKSYGIFMLDPKSGPQTTLVFDDPNWDDMDPVALASRREPAGRSSVVNYARQAGQLYCLNAYLSDDDRKSRVPSGSIRGIRVWRFDNPALEAPTDRSSNSTSRTANRPLGESNTLLGEYQVDSDGSFFLEVPAQTPLRLETLDESGSVLRKMRTWMWVMPGEHRGCIGCHEDRELTATNRHVLALRRRPQEVGNTAVPPPSAVKPPEQPGRSYP